MNNALVFAATQYLRRGKFSFLKKTLAPQKYQARFLFSLLKAHRDTEFGQIHRFAALLSNRRFSIASLASSEPS